MKQKGLDVSEELPPYSQVLDWHWAGSELFNELPVLLTMVFTVFVEIKISKQN